MNNVSRNARIIFLEAIDRAPELRPAFLNAACGEDLELRERVERLVRAHEQLGEFHDADTSGSVTIDHFLPEKQGTHIGPYKLMEQIGEGGMGMVYLAAQKEPIRRLVALKLIKPGMDSRQIIARLDAERQVLAMMDHPFIARLFDAGTTANGRPYFVMELVRGLPITKFCDENRLNLHQRLELIVQVCEAVQHAHQKGIIHRDLKPSNVLVTIVDGKPVPKVIDFGIAKALGPPANEHSLQTGFSQLVGTPLYMSPEQAEMNPLLVDTRSDVYSLGVLFYELLIGSTPFTDNELRQVGLVEMQRMICDVEPPRPSKRLMTLSEEDQRIVAARRGIDPRRLENLFPGELDWIAMKALEKDRERRYSSALALADDCRRFLAGDSVHAYPPSLAYRARKWVLRRRTTAVFVALIIFFVMAGLTGTSIGLWRANKTNRQLTKALRDLDQQRALTLENAVKAETRELAAKTEKYYSLVYRVRESSLRRDWGWSQRNLRDLREATRLNVRGKDPVALRTLAAESLSAFDLVAAGRVATDIAPRVLAFSPNGPLLAVGQKKHGVSPGVHVYDLTTGKLVQKHTISNLAEGLKKLFIERADAFQDGYRGLAFSPDGRWLAAGTRFGRIVVWDTRSPSSPPRSCQPFSGEENVHCLRFVDHGETLFAATTDEHVARWRFLAEDQAEPMDWRAGSIAVAPRMEVLATAHNGVLHLRDLRNPGRAMEFSELLKDRVRSVWVGTDERYLMVELPREWVLVSLSNMHIMRRYRLVGPGLSAWNEVSFNASNKAVAISSRDGIEFVSPTTGRSLGQLEVPGSIDTGAVFSPEGNWLAVNHADHVQLYQVRQDNAVHVVGQTDRFVGDISWSADGKRLLTLGLPWPYGQGNSSWHEQRLAEYDATTGELLQHRQLTTNGPYSNQQVCFLEPVDGTPSHIASFYGPGLLLLTERNRRTAIDYPASHLGEAHAASEQSCLQVEPETAATVVHDPDAADNKALRVALKDAAWRVRVDLSHLGLPEHADQVFLYALMRGESSQVTGSLFRVHLKSSNGKESFVDFPARLTPRDNYGLILLEGLYASEFKDSELRVLPAEDTQPEGFLWFDKIFAVPRHFRDPLQPVGPIAVPPSGTPAWVAYDRMYLTGLQLPQLRQVHDWNNLAATMFTGRSMILTVEAGRRWVAVGGASESLSLLEHGSYRTTALGPGGETVALALSPDEDILVLGTDTGQLRVVGLPDCRTLADLPPHEHGVNSVEFSPDGKWLLTCSSDETLRLWSRQGNTLLPFTSLPVESKVARAKWSPDGKSIAIYGRIHAAAAVWNLDRLQARLSELSLLGQ